MRSTDGTSANSLLVRDMVLSLASSYTTVRTAPCVLVQNGSFVTHQAPNSRCMISTMSIQVSEVTAFEERLTVKQQGWDFQSVIACANPPPSVPTGSVSQRTAQLCASQRAPVHLRRILAVAGLLLGSHIRFRCHVVISLASRMNKGTFTRTTPL